MATPQLSPGVLIREVDLTVGRADNVLANIGGIAGPFPTGPVEEVVDITTEQELIKVFGKPISQDSQYEYWMTASAYLSYGGVLKVVRADSDNLVNANAIRNSSGVSTVGQADLKIKNFDDYELNYADDVADYIFAAKTPGSWSNDLKVCVIDDKADQILQVGSGVAGISSVGYGVTFTLTNQVVPGIGVTSMFNGYLKAIITGVADESIDVKVTSLVDNTNTEIPVNYQQKAPYASFTRNTEINIINNAGAAVTAVTIPDTAEAVKDWYDEQFLELTNTRILWSSIAPKPTTTEFALDRNSKNDAIHVAIVDDLGTVTGVQGNLLEKFLFLSKASDSISSVNPAQPNWWKTLLAQTSSYVYVGDNPSDDANVDEPVFQTGFSEDFTPYTNSESLWNLPAQDRTFSALGNVTYTLLGGKNYTTVNDGYTATLGNLITAYRKLSNRDEIPLDFVIMGPGLGNKFESQAKAQELISLANTRKDCIAVISPHRGDVVDVTNSNTQTDNIIEFFSPLSSSSYAVFDTGYKYTFDRFNNRFRFIPCNGDVAGLMVRTTLTSYPWFSPAGQQRGILNNAIKLAFNPNRAQRDRLYPLRVNSIINQPGIGILLFGDKTALGYASAFDRINVRRLFLTVQAALERSAQAQLFELNDPITRANFINIVEPYLRDVQAKRGLFDFRVICDETNNTPDVIDNNEFRADIFLKPTRSINYVTLTFVATRTGVSFEEVTGRV